MDVIALIAVIVLWVAFSNLKTRVAKLEQLLSNRTAPTPQEGMRTPNMTMPQGAHTSVPAYAAPQAESSPVPQYIPSNPYAAKDSEANAIIEWFTTDVLMKVGALFLLMGIGWFVGYAFIHDWIGPVGRVLLGLCTGAGILALGIWRIKTHEHQGAIFTVLGSTVVLLTVSAARFTYDMFTPLSALGLMFVSILFVTFVSLQYRRNGLALASLILAAIAPYLTATQLGMFESFTYLLLIVLGTLWVVYITGWRNLTFAALAITFMYTVGYANGWNPDRYVALLWAFGFTAIFFVANVVSLIRQQGQKLSQIHLATALGTAFYLMVWILEVVPEESQSLLFVAWMLVFSFGAYLAYRSTGAQAPFYVYGGTSIALLGAATAAELEGAVLTIAFTFEVAVLVYISAALRLSHKVTTLLSSLFVIPLLLSLESIDASAWRYGVLHEHFFNLLVLTLVLLIIGIFVIERQKNTSETPSKTGPVLVTLGVIYSLMLLWLVTHAIIPDSDTATMITLILYTVCGITAYFNGRNSGNHGMRVGGGVLLGLVVCRLLLIDVWLMDIVGKIVTFLAIGVMLLSTAFIRNKNKHNQ